MTGAADAAEPIDAFILAGGKSRRMGRNKALLEIGGRRILERVMDAAATGGRRVVLVANDPETYQHFGLETIGDRWPGCGPLGGIGTALWKARSDRALVLACDLPNLTAPFLSWLAALDEGADVALTETVAEGLHPLCAVYSRRCLQAIGRRVGARQLKVTAFFDEVIVRVAKEAEMRAAGFSPELVANLNTPEDYERARAREAEAAGRERERAAGRRAGVPLPRRRR